MSTCSHDPSKAAPQVNCNPQLQAYYHSLESRIGYWLLLGGTRHFGYWNRDTYWPFPLSKALRAMEDKLAEMLALPRGARVLDTGCGVGHVALRMAQLHGLRISAIDIIDHHIEKASRNFDRSGLPKGTIAVHSCTPPRQKRYLQASTVGILRPGGRIVLFEYDHELVENSPEDMAALVRKINKHAAMPTNDRSNPGVFKTMLENAGFEDVIVRDFSENINPMTRLFFYLAILPYLIVHLFGLERYFINTMAGVESYRGHGRWRYVAITATKPGGLLEAAKTR
ncbi:S-adenosyl-L-methionine-dependent methyltransferase [Immersiella caudata]|uniref:S-adenosyl-L-methionine-dependent methyltransferase n=1 Tax=Immersiella caudata TaxID=314043 RepID=A0AA39WQ07_9PEZI|nr:S-adenosyl-L-methionine-dependent methyltransferase [Immersiella caudata]